MDCNDRTNIRIYSHSQHVKERFYFCGAGEGANPLQPEVFCPDRSFPAWVGAMRLLFGYYEWMKVRHPFALAGRKPNHSSIRLGFQPAPTTNQRRLFPQQGASPMTDAELANMPAATVNQRRPFATAGRICP